MISVQTAQPRTHHGKSGTARSAVSKTPAQFMHIQPFLFDLKEAKAYFLVRLTKPFLLDAVQPIMNSMLIRYRDMLADTPTTTLTITDKIILLGIYNRGQQERQENRRLSHYINTKRYPLFRR